MYQQASYSPHRSTYWPRRPRFVQPASCLCLQATRRGPPLSPHPKTKHGSEKRAGDRFPRNPAARCRSVSETPPLASYLTPTRQPSLPPLPRNMAERHAHSPTYRVTKSFPGVGWRWPRRHFSASQSGRCVFFSFFLSTVSFVVLFLFLLPPR